MDLEKYRPRKSKNPTKLLDAVRPLKDQNRQILLDDSRNKRLLEKKNVLFKKR